MLRLVKILNSNNQYEVVRLKYNLQINLGPGSALGCTGGIFTTAMNTDMPAFVALGICDTQTDKMDAICVTEDMIFKTEYTGTATPYVGMIVGLSTHKYKLDAVTFNSNGKGIVVGVDDSKKLVYVRFHR